jgi:hypothetical protein
VARIPLFAAGLGLTAVIASACDREAEPLLCGELAPGDLVISEVRGGPSVVDGDGQWIELYNASGRQLELEGVALTLESASGSESKRLLVRRSQIVAAGDYVVLGNFDDASRPAHVDVGWGTKPTIERDRHVVVSCGAVVDEIVFTSLPDPSQIEDTLPRDPPPPNHGTYALGLEPPDAAGNDDAGNWCPDATITDGPCTATVCLEKFLGSPGEPNPACPP